jgi:hypothetical protein
MDLERIVSSYLSKRFSEDINTLLKEVNTIGWNGWHITMAVLKSIMKKESGLFFDSET